MVEKPFIEFRIAVCFSPYIMIRFRVERELDIAATAFECLDHLFRFFGLHNIVFGSMKYPGRNGFKKKCMLRITDANAFGQALGDAGVVRRRFFRLHRGAHPAHYTWFRSISSFGCGSK